MENEQEQQEQSDNVVDIASKPSSLKAQLEAERVAQREAFIKELEALLAHHNCSLIPTFKIGDQDVAVAAVVNFPMTIQIISQS